MNNKFGRVLAVPSLCELYPGICLTTEEKAREKITAMNRVLADYAFRIVVYGTLKSTEC
jgi:hypothetical protein